MDYFFLFLASAYSCANCEFEFTDNETTLLIAIVLITIATAIHVAL